MIVMLGNKIFLIIWCCLSGLLGSAQNQPTVFKMLNPNSDLSDQQVELMIGTMQHHKEDVEKDFYAAQDIMNRIKQAISAYEDTLKAKNKKAPTKSSRRK